jgi:hypothetical protein
MARWFMVAAAVVALTLAAVPSFAHDDFRVVGTVTKHQHSEIAIKNAAGKTTVIRINKQTEISRDKKKVDATELKVGQSVVVDAYGDSEADLLALEIRIVPPIGKR